MNRLDGKVVLMTGADGGIGSALARSLGADGAQLVLHGEDPVRLDALATDIGGDPSRHMLDAHDVTNERAVTRAVQAAIDRFGQIDILINLAGINRFGGILRCTADEWDAVQSTNVKGYFLTTRAVVPAMKAAGHGSILNMSSVWGVRGNARMMAYSTSKHAVEGFTASLRQEVAPWGIKVSSLVVGIVDTPFRDAMKDHVTFTAEQCANMLKACDVVDAIRYMLDTSNRALPSSLTLEAWLVQ